MMNPRVRQLLKRAETLAEQRRWETAERSYRELVAESPEFVDAWLGLAQVIQNEQERQTIFQRVLELDPQNSIAAQGLDGQLIPLPLQPIKPSPLDVENSSPPVAEGTPTLETNKAAAEDVIGLRCNRCGKLLDAKTAIRTSVGYRCENCLKEMQAAFYTATLRDYAVAIAVALPISLVAGWFFSIAGIFAILLGAGTGSAIGAAVWRLIGRRRGRYLPIVVAICVALGGVAPLIITWNLYAIVYAILAAGSAFYRLKA